MTTPFHLTPDLRGLNFEDAKVTLTLASAIVKADEGKPVTIDSVNNRVKLAGDGDNILGVLEVVEDRVQEGIKVGTIAMRYVQEWTIKSADALAVGDVAIGAGSGEVKKASLGTAMVVGSPDTPNVLSQVKPWGFNVVVSVSGGKAVVARF